MKSVVKPTIYTVLFGLGISLFITLTYGCKKKSLEYKLEGVINDKSFNNTLNGATVTLQATYAGSSVLIDLGSTVTGSNGAYSFTFKREKYESIVVTVSKNNYFGESYTTTLDNLDIENTNTKNFDCYAYSWAKIHITGDGIHDCKYIRQQGYSGCSECCPTTEQYFTTPTDTTRYCINKGNTIYQVYYNVLGTTLQGPVGATTTPFDTTEILIAY